MNTVFADTFYYAAVLSPRDIAHEAATKWSQTSSGTAVTTEFVLMELGNGFAGTPQRQAFASFVSHLRTFPDTIIVPASPELFQAALDLFARRADKEWSLTDCSSFVVMEQRGIEEALTADHHFTQAGYRVLLA